MAENSKNFKPNNTSNIDTDVFVKGMVKDSHESFVGKENWVHCRNCINNSAKGDAGTIGNEPANLICVQTGYVIIGAVYLYGDKWIIYSGNNTWGSEIGLFDDSQCEYITLINDEVLNFRHSNLVTGAAKENYDCTWQIYWDDGLNPSRTLNLGFADSIPENKNVPWYQEQIAGPEIDGTDCVVFQDIEPLRLNPDLIRLAPLMKTPCVEIAKAEGPGQLANGSYQAYVAYTINEQQIGDYIGVSNIQPLFDNDGTACSLDIKISNLDKNFEFYKLVILANNQQQPTAVQVGFYSTDQTTINIDYIPTNKATAQQVPLQNLTLQNPAYEKSDKMVPLNDYLLRLGPTTNFDFNYQPLANNITAKWVSVEYPAEYYKNGGNNATFMRDEQYAFFIRFIYQTGEKSSSYHIPGREALADELNTALTDGNNILSSDETQPWQVTNTAFVDEFDGSTTLSDGGVILSKGQMGYWQSSEQYPSQDPHGRWADLCGKNIRHHKMPDEQTDETVDRSNSDNQKLRVLGVEFDNIVWPVDNDNQLITNIVGYEILVGSREGNKSILSKGLLRNMKQYPLPAGTSGADSSTTSVGIMPNYPYNSVNDDPYLTVFPPQMLDNNNPPAMDGGYTYCGTFNSTGTCNNFYTFHSPETSFQRPYLNPAEIRSYGMTLGLSQGHFKKSEGHPKNTLIRDFAAIIAAIVGVGYGLSKMRGKRTTKSAVNAVSPGQMSLYQGLEEAAETQFTLGSLAAPGISEVAYFQTTAGLLDTAALANTVIYPPILSATSQVDGYQEAQFEGTDIKSLPNLAQIVTGIFMTFHYAGVGGDIVIDFIYNVAGLTDHAWKYNSYGLYSNTQTITSGQVFRNNVTKGRYVGNTLQDFGSTNINLGARINNLHRPATVVIQSAGTFGNGATPLLNQPNVGFGFYDSSRFTIGNVGLHYNPGAGIISGIAAHYVGLKFAIDNQYGQLDGIKQIPIPCSQKFIRNDNTIVDSTTLIDGEEFTSDVLFGGDCYINRYNEKVIMPFFWEFLNGQPDKFAFDYRDYQNVPYTRYWMDTTKYDIHNILAPITDFSFDWTDGDAVPSAMRNMDRPDGFGINADMSNDQTGLYLATGPGNYGDYQGSGNSMFILRNAYMYTHCSGINDFFVESELNVGLRSQGNSTEQKHYDWSDYTDYDALFHADIVNKGNFYKYDFSLSKTNLVSQMVTYGLLQPRDYDPEVADTCYDHYTKRIIYSNQAHKEAKKDFWRVYLPNNYQDFKNVPTTVKPVSKSGAMILFPHLAPQLFQGVDTLTTDFNTKLTIGDGGLFNDPMQQISTADLPHEYGSCENSLSVINTPAGIYYISQAQGKIFNYSQSLTNIADAGMKQWFNTYLPSRLLKAFPELEGTKFADNPVIGIGCQSVYDPNYDIVYFSKKDYEPCNPDGCLQFDPSIPRFWINETECNGIEQNIDCPIGAELTCNDEQPEQPCECCYLCEADFSFVEENDPSEQCCQTQIEPYQETPIDDIDSQPNSQATGGGFNTTPVVILNTAGVPIDQSGDSISLPNTIAKISSEDKTRIRKSVTKDPNKTMYLEVLDFLVDSVIHRQLIDFNLNIPFFDDEVAYLELKHYDVRSHDFIYLENKIETKYDSFLRVYKIDTKQKNKKGNEDRYLGSIAFFPNGKLIGTIKRNEKTYEISKAESNEYVLYEVSDLKERKGFTCDTEDTINTSAVRKELNRRRKEERSIQNASRMVDDDGISLDIQINACLRMAVDIDTYSFELTDNAFAGGFVTIEYIIAMLTNVDIIFSEQLNLNVVLVAANIYTDESLDPYASLPDGVIDPDVTINALNIMMNEWTTSPSLAAIDRSVVNFWTFKNLKRNENSNNSSKAFGIGGLCVDEPPQGPYPLSDEGNNPSGNEAGYAVCSLEFTAGQLAIGLSAATGDPNAPFQSLSQSWALRVICHENGHVMGGHHTNICRYDADEEFGYSGDGVDIGDGTFGQGVLTSCQTYDEDDPLVSWITDSECIINNPQYIPNQPYWPVTNYEGGVLDYGTIMNNSMSCYFAGEVSEFEFNPIVRKQDIIPILELRLEDGCLDCAEPPPPPPPPDWFCDCSHLGDDWTLVITGTDIPASLLDCYNVDVLTECKRIFCQGRDCVPATYEDVITEIDIQDSNYFKDVSWTASYDPKIKGWISFHDWHPELNIQSHNHFLTTNTRDLPFGQCPEGWTFNPILQECELNRTEQLPAEVITDIIPCDCPDPNTGPTDIVFSVDASGSTSGGGIYGAQFEFVNDVIEQLQPFMDAGLFQVGTAIWSGTGQTTVTTPTGGAMSTIGYPATPSNIYNGMTSIQDGVQIGFDTVTDCLNSSLGCRDDVRRIVVVVTDAYGNDSMGNGCGFVQEGVTPFATCNTTCAEIWSVQVNPTALCFEDLPFVVQNSLTNIGCGGNAYGYGPNQGAGPWAIGYANGYPCDSLSPITNRFFTDIFGTCECECPEDYTFVGSLDPQWDIAIDGSIIDVVSGNPLYPGACVKTECSCPGIEAYDTSIPGNVDAEIETLITESGVCDDPYLWGMSEIYGLDQFLNPFTYVNPDPRQCNFFMEAYIPPTLQGGGIWKHNVRCDLFNNYYEIQYPWEVELIEAMGQSVNTVRSVEYQLEAYQYQPKVDANGCVINFGCDDRWHDLMYNFDEAIIYNTEQVSGLLVLNQQTANINDSLQYPIINTEDIQILYSKVEQKYRFDQFWDVTADRSVQEPIFITQLNGYIRDLNAAYMDYNKPQLERKKFRHYTNNLILRKRVQYFNGVIPLPSGFIELQECDCFEEPDCLCGCTDPNAENYNELATLDNGTCFYVEAGCPPNTICGCMDSEALNYNPGATFDNGSCVSADTLIYSSIDLVPEQFDINGNLVDPDALLHTRKMILKLVNTKINLSIR